MLSSTQTSRVKARAAPHAHVSSNLDRISHSRVCSRMVPGIFPPFSSNISSCWQGESLFHSELSNTITWSLIDEALVINMAAARHNATHNRHGMPFVTNLWQCTEAISCSNQCSCLFLLLMSKQVGGYVTFMIHTCFCTLCLFISTACSDQFCNPIKRIEVVSQKQGERSKAEPGAYQILTLRS